MITSFEDHLRVALRDELSDIDQGSLARTTLPPPAPRSRRGAVVAVAAAVVAVTLTASIVALAQRHSDVASPPVAPSTTAASTDSAVAQVKVPDVLSMDSTQARSLVDKAHLKYVERSVWSSQPKGLVVQQEPGPHAVVAPGATVTVYVSQGQEMTIVPDTGEVVGKDLKVATAALTAAHLQVVSQYEKSVKPKDQVLSWDQTAGSQVPVGTPVTLKISDNSQMTVPDLSGMKPDQALAALKQAQWAGADTDLVQTTKEDSDHVLWGLIVAQQPLPNAVVDKNSVIAVTIATEPHVPMPDLTGKTVSQAKDLLTASGWYGQLTVQLHRELTATKDQANKIFDQTPAPSGLILVTDPIIVDVYPES